MKLRIGLPKGSLESATFELFRKAGFEFVSTNRNYQPLSDDPELEPTLLRPQEIPLYVQDGVLDCGLTGHDWVVDCGADVHEICELRYSKLTSNPIRIVLAVHNDSPYQSARDLQGKRIATEYVRLTNRFLEEQGVAAEVEFSWGACEVKVPELVDAIVVNTETGSSLRAHNLRVIETLLVSTTRFIANHDSWADPQKQRKMRALEVLLTGAMNASKLVGLKMNVPVEKLDDVLGVLPALQNPTVNDLSDRDWKAVEVVLEEKMSRDLIPQLKEKGATGIVEYPLNKVIY
ncbi:MAG: ATP phosphoribosyltransferase [Fimbriimonadales bacterium]|nr:MAG: ATP phosphoribosyltransferase [Fimbriimonadales bacterium]